MTAMRSKHCGVPRPRELDMDKAGDEAHEDSKQAKGGRARAEGMSKSERSASSRHAALAGWEKEKGPMPEATHEGELQLGSVEIPCAVLDDKRRVLTQSGFMVALGRARQAKGRDYYEGDVNLPAFLTAKNL